MGTGRAIATSGRLALALATAVIASIVVVAAAPDTQRRRLVELPHPHPPADVGPDVIAVAPELVAVSRRAQQFDYGVVT